MKEIKDQYQTPPAVANYMAAMIPWEAITFYEPMPGNGALVDAIVNEMTLRFRINSYHITTNDDYFNRGTLKKAPFDCILMNPPFSDKSAFNVPDNEKYEGMKFGYQILSECMEISDNIIALMPWFTIVDSDVRLREIYKFGLKSITALPRKTFDYARIQTCILEMDKNFKGDTLFKMFNVNLLKKQK